MPEPKAQDFELIQHLHELIFFDKRIRTTIDSAFEQTEKCLYSEENILPYASGSTPITIFKEALPDALAKEINLCRTFILKKGVRMSPSEIHRNSIQRLVSYRNSGAIHCATAGESNSFLGRTLINYSDNPESAVKDCWDIVDANTWHFPEASTDGDWYTITFHSASAATIIEERGHSG